MSLKSPFGTLGGGSGGGAGLPSGGTKGQLLAKASDADGDVQWGTVPQFLAPPDEYDETSDTDYFYMGWLSLDGTWKVRRRDRGTFLTTDAGVDNNSGVLDLPTAWPLRSSLTYS